MKKNSFVVEVTLKVKIHILSKHISLRTENEKDWKGLSLGIKDWKIKWHNTIRREKGKILRKHATAKHTQK